MTALEKAKIVHEEAMFLSQEADMAKLMGDNSKAQTLYKQSFVLENEAAVAYAYLFDKEPIRSILYRSAASLAIECQLFREASQLIHQGLTNNTPPDVADELHDLYKQLPQNQITQGNDFWISGVLKRADADKNTILLVSKAPNNLSQTNYTITVLSETLNNLVKNYWDDMVKVHIKPKSKKGRYFQYELIDVQI